MDWVGLGNNKRVLAFDPVDGCGGVDVFLGCERTCVTPWDLLQDGLVLEAGYGCGKGDLVWKMLRFENCFFCLRFFLDCESVQLSIETSSFSFCSALALIACLSRLPLNQ